jgi:hypothetical protein
MILMESFEVGEIAVVFHLSFLNSDDGSDIEAYFT